MSRIPRGLLAINLVGATVAACLAGALNHGFAAKSLGDNLSAGIVITMAIVVVLNFLFLLLDGDV